MEIPPHPVTNIEGSRALGSYAKITKPQDHKSGPSTFETSCGPLAVNPKPSFLARNPEPDEKP